MAELINTILSILILISIGFISKKTGLLKKEHASVLNNIIIYISMPALIFRAVFESKLSVSLLIIPLLAVVISGLSMGIAFLAGRWLHLKKPTFGALLLAAAIGNTGYLGYPLSLQLFGIQNLVKAIFYDLSGTVLFTFTVGLLVSQKYGRGTQQVNIAREIFTFPPLLGLFAALLLKSFILPKFFTDTVGFLAGATIPLIMFSIGLSLEMAHVGLYRREIGVAGLIKLVISPALALIGAVLVGMKGTTLGVVTLEASMPTFLLSLVLGIRYGLDVDFLPAVIVATTAISMLTIPVWQYVLRLIM